MLLAYCRVSTEEQAADGTTSLAEQERKVRGLGMMQGASKYDVQVYVDAGVSGSVPLAQRPAGKRLLDEARAGDILCAAKLDRLFRSASDALQTVEALQKQGVKVVLLDIAVEPVTENGVAKLFFTILSAVAEFERGRIQERIADGRRCKKERGGHAGGEAPYGWKIVGKGREAKLEKVESEQNLLTVVEMLSRDSDSPTIIAREINERGYTSRAGKPFQPAQAYRLMKRAQEMAP